MICRTKGRQIMMDFQRFLNEDPVRAVPIVIITALIYWFVRKSRHKRKFGDNFKEIRKKARLNEIIRLLFVCYTAELICCTMFPTGFWWKLWNPWILTRPDMFTFFRFTRWRFTPILWAHFVEYSGKLLAEFQWKQIFLDFVLNIVLYIPLGLALPFVWKRACFVKTVFAGLACTLLIEFMQAFIFRDPNIDDVICNTLGAAFGYLIYLIMNKVFPKFTDKCKVRAVP